ncbi:MAG: hypothetical protein KA807_04625 [Prolixibacteraceae bacterium]|nr:hypothetical protein [Prolixibacteraceae bacterium]
MNKLLIYKKSCLIIAAALIAVIYSCEENSLDPKFTPAEGINIIIGNQAIITSDMIEYYDNSTKMFFLNNKLPEEFDYYEKSKFWITDNKEIIFEGALRLDCPCGTDSTIKTELHTGYFNFTMKLVKSQANMSYYCSSEDETNNELFTGTLKKYGKYREGLKAEIDEIKRLDSYNIQVTIKVTNLDSVSYYIPDPEKMGINFYHSLTGGLTLQDPNNYDLTANNIKIMRPHKNNVKVSYPEVSGTWDKNWLTLIEGKEDFYFTLDYTQFDPVYPGKYAASFNFTGLKGNLENKDLQLDDGRIWIGEIGLSKEIEL